MNEAEKFRENGWRFFFSRETRFLSAHHEEGGKFDVCEFHSNGKTQQRLVNEAGYALEALLNGEKPN